MSDNDLSPPGSSTYSSNTLHVGDGTWDNGRDTFLLPNLVGLNFETMQYNGMGNRFRGLPEYQNLILGHGVLAAITFIGILPAAVFFAKFGFFDRRKSLKIHVYLQIILLFTSTIIVITGYFAVGPERSMTNPHHQIGVAIYVLIWAQFFFGWIMSRIEKRRKNPLALTRSPKKVWFHKIFGRSIALLGFVQVALGLTLYGSPKALFVLYALAGALLLFLYLGMDRYYYEKRQVDLGDPGRGRPGAYTEYDSYISGSRTELTQAPRKESHWGRNALAAVGALGAYEAYKHRRMRKREETEQMQIDEERRQQGRMSRPTSAGGTSYGPSRRTGSRPPGTPGPRPPGPPLSPESWEDEKYSQAPQKHTWRDRLLGAGAGIAAFEGARRLFGKKRDDDRGHGGQYRPPLGGSQSFVSQTDVSRVQNGHVPFSPGTPGGRVGNSRVSADPTTPSRLPRRPRPSGDSVTFDEDVSEMTSQAPHQRESQGLRQSILTLGAIAGFREWNKQRKQRRIDQQDDMRRRQDAEDEERFNRRTSTNYPRPQDGAGGRPSTSAMSVTTGTADPGFGGSNPELSRHNFRPSTSHTNPGLDTMHPPLPAAAGTIPSATSPDVYSQHTNQYPASSQGYQLPPPPPGPPPKMGRRADYQPPEPGSLQMPSGAVNPDPSRLVSHDSGAADAAAAGLFGAAAGAMAGGPHQSQSPSRQQGRDDSRVPRASRRNSLTSASPFAGPAAAPISTSSPPISLKINMHNDGRHVTLRQLSEQEAAAERARRQQASRPGRRQSSLSSGMEDESTGPQQRYRRRNNVRPSNDQPITNVPPPPAMSNSAIGSNRPNSDLNLPPAPAAPAPAALTPGRAQANDNPSEQRLSPANAPSAAGMGSVMSGGFGSPGDAGTGTDVSAFADNRRRRRAERARRLEAARGGNRVEFE